LWSSHTLRGLAYVFTDLLIGFLASATGDAAPPASSALILAWRGRLQQLTKAFSDVVAAQLRIAAANTVLTAIYLLLVLPLLGQNVPLASTLVALTFFTSL
jgi:predicted PurR-regulated permease PerM